MTLPLILLLTATLLGALAFFEPCTIATHTLFSARTHKQSSAGCYRSLFLVWFSRCLLFIAIFSLAVAALPVPHWGAIMPSIILSIMALLYLASRFTYIPVPHLTFYRLLPGSERFSDATRLGLTLPACTLPLLVVVTGLAVTVDSFLFALLAGLLFATLFTVPLAMTSINGISRNGLDLLDKAATGSPYLTAVLLFGAALYLLVPGLNVDTDVLRTTLQETPMAGIGLAFLAGFVFSFNPVSFASIPVVLAYVTKAHEERRAVLLGAAFILGMIVTHVTLGVAAALGGDWVKSVMGRGWNVFLGPLLIILGLVWAGWLKLRLPWISARARKVYGVWGAFALGIPFSVAICPFCAPALLVTLTASAAIGSVAYGFTLLLAFSLGRSIPILLGAWSMGWLESLRVLSKHQRILEITAGLTLIATGLIMLNQYFLIV